MLTAMRRDLARKKLEARLGRRPDRGALHARGILRTRADAKKLNMEHLRAGAQLARALEGRLESGAAAPSTHRQARPVKALDLARALNSRPDPRVLEARGILPAGSDAARAAAAAKKGGYKLGGGAVAAAVAAATADPFAGWRAKLGTGATKLSTVASLVSKVTDAARP